MPSQEQKQICEWNCYARNYYLGAIKAINARLAIELAVSIFKKYSFVQSEISVIQKHKDYCRNKVNIDSCRDYKVKYPC